MAESTIRVDFSGIYSAISNSESRLRDNLDTVYSLVQDINSNVATVYRAIAQMRKENQMSFAYQRAISEIIRVKQEIEEKFSAHQKVRQAMIGILQANDLKLVKQTTIANTSEELMIAAPDYWLAPSLIALSGWIANDEALAKRALEEALKRDKEKTCLLFALICNRNGRTQTCYEWLNEYFKLQNPKRMRKSVVAFIDAYSNGVFGEDTKHVCDEHIAHWMKVLKDDDPDFDARQKAFWETFFESGAVPTDGIEGDVEYTSTLKAVCPEWEDMDAFVKRIVIVEDEQGQIGKLRGIHNAKIDVTSLKAEIDEQLSRLVTNYEEGSEEANLRDELTNYTMIRNFKGDEDKAKAFIDLIKLRRTDVPVDFTRRLEQAIASGGTDNASLAGKKAALFLLKPWMREAYTNYVTANIERYPEKINLQVKQSGTSLNATIPGSKVYTRDFTWKGDTQNAENRKDLLASIGKQYDQEKNEAIAKVKPSVLAIFPGFIFLGIPTIITMSRTKKRKAELEEKFEAAKKKTQDMVSKALTAREKANEVVLNFTDKEHWDKIKLGEDDYYSEKDLADSVVGEEVEAAVTPEEPVEAAE